jgi:peptidoglycan/xylan/chitin deacetylase (PgdA/CDA1 family)
LITTQQAMVSVAHSVRLQVRDIAGDVLHRFGLTRPARSARGRLTIVALHRVLPHYLRAEYPLPGLVVSPDELDFIIGVMAQHYTLDTLAAVAGRLRAGEVPDKPLAAITFDDGQRDNLEYAAPVLRAHGVRGTFFAVSDATEHNTPLWHDRLGFALAHLPGGLRQLDIVALGLPANTDRTVQGIVEATKLLRPSERDALIARVVELSGGAHRPGWDGIMSWQDLKQLQSDGHEIGSHTRSHPILPLATDGELIDELAGSREALEQKLGTPVLSFCYPNGDHDARVMAAVERAGYRFATTTQPGLNARHAAPLQLRRFDMQGRFARRGNGRLAAQALHLRLSNALRGA